MHLRARARASAAAVRFSCPDTEGVRLFFRFRSAERFGSISIRSCRAENWQPLPKFFRSSSEVLPKFFRSSSEVLPKFFRSVWFCQLVTEEVNFETEQTNNGNRHCAAAIFSLNEQSFLLPRLSGSDTFFRSSSEALRKLFGSSSEALPKLFRTIFVRGKSQVEYSVAEIAKNLKISERAVLYKIKAGELEGKKKDRRWAVSFPGQNQQTAEHNDQKQSAASEIPKIQKEQNRGVFRAPSSGNKKSSAYHREQSGKLYDFTQLVSYKLLRKWYEHPGLRNEQKHLDHIQRCLERIAIGFYQWDVNQKIRIYNESRNLVGSYLNFIVLHQLEDKKLQKKLFEGIHCAVMGAIIALTKSLEKKRKTVHENAN